MPNLINRLGRLERANAPALPTCVASAPSDWTKEEAEERLHQMLKEQGVEVEYDTLIIPQHGRLEGVGILWWGDVDAFFADIAANSSRLGCEPRSHSKFTNNTEAVS